MVVLALFNLLAGVVSVVWLLAKGQWLLVVLALGSLVVAPFIMALVSLPSLIFVGPAMFLMEKRQVWLGSLLGFCGTLYINAVQGIWALYWFNMSYEADSSLRWPTALFAYALAYGPAAYMSEKEGPEAGGSQLSAVAIMFGSLGALLSLTVFNSAFGAVSSIAAAVLLVSVVQAWLAASEARSMAAATV